MPTVKDIIITKNAADFPPDCKVWPIWTHGPDSFDWEYTQTEKCLILEGRVTIADRPAAGQTVSFGPGDFVVFPKGLKCRWTIQKAVRKHYNFE